MDRERRKPRLDENDGMDVVGFDDFCLSTGLDRTTAERLFRTTLLDGSVWSPDEPSRPRSILVERLPSRESLVALGLAVRDDYNPERLRFGGIECRTHGWVPSVLLTSEDDQRVLPVGSMCEECSRAGIPPDDGNSTRLSPARVDQWRRTHDRDGNWLGDDPAD